jgi:hypothetical protein
MACSRPAKDVLKLAAPMTVFLPMDVQNMVLRMKRRHCAEHRVSTLLDEGALLRIHPPWGLWGRICDLQQMLRYADSCPCREHRHDVASRKDDHPQDGRQSVPLLNALGDGNRRYDFRGGMGDGLPWTLAGRYAEDRLAALCLMDEMACPRAVRNCLYMRTFDSRISDKQAWRRQPDENLPPRGAEQMDELAAE